MMYPAKKCEKLTSEFSLVLIWHVFAKLDTELSIHRVKLPLDFIYGRMVVATWHWQKETYYCHN